MRSSTASGTSPRGPWAKKDTIDKVCGIVKKELVVAQDTLVNGDTKFADLGADSLDTRIKEIVCAAELRLDKVSLWLVLSRSNRLGLLKSAPQRLQTPSLQRTRPSASDRPTTVVRLLQCHRLVVLPSKWLLIVAKEWMVIYLLILQPSPMLSRPLR
ncbi:uncharacterized protein LOC123426214 [Hordeum vulgare subsp. vulgare]|uniref:uncharacterized protein LOC123426214 n=1 Tax=Hordeum vulgare subsp. vulgare TaxID=112509 RepID=UPI00162C9454|nr:uncharacterized protein LOC123426214 [Hordeum vulgare subsp. vulgare]